MKRLFTRRTAGTDAKVDRLVMEYARRSAASPLLQHTERLVLDRSEGIAHLSSVGKHTAERRCSLPSAAARLLDTLPQPFLWMFSGGCCCGGAGGTVRAQSFSGVRIVCLRSGFCRFPGRKEDFSRKIVIFASGASVYGSSERKR